MADLAEVLRLAAAGVFPPVDGGWERVPPWRDGVEAVVALTGHAFLAVADDVDDAALAALRPDGLGGAHDPRLVTALAAGGWVDSLDVLLAATGGGRPAEESRLVAREDLSAHPRAVAARALRGEVRVVGRPGADPSLVTVGAGVAGLTELGAEVVAGTDGARLVADVVASLPAGSPVLAAVAPGNARSLRSFLRAGFRPVGSVQVYRPARRR
ncbi:N-acetyltransferase [Aquipuribacter hungaricus]|uniref:N-acetyltransferase n=1 Tax=Aquipuribacter hungaricus TaxID=545624 RepID=A0ABV7WJC6_9MICO